MSSKPRLLAFGGSLRRGSWNGRLVRIAANGATAAGADVTHIDLRDYPLPVFDEDLEAASGLPDSGRKLKDLFLANDGLLISSPEYNSSITAALKNVIDWVSRPAAGEAPLACFAGKVAGIMATSPGALGGLRGLVHLRAILGNIQVLVLPDQVAVPRAHEAFDDHGQLRDAKLQAAVEGIGRRLAEVVARLKR